MRILFKKHSNSNLQSRPSLDNKNFSDLVKTQRKLMYKSAFCETSCQKFVQLHAIPIVVVMVPQNITKSPPGVVAKTYYYKFKLLTGINEP